MKKRTKALDISKVVKDKVWERDRHECIICHSPYAMPNSHYIARSQGGLGIEENIGTMCIQCHHDYDHTPKRKDIKEKFKQYLQSKYPAWHESKLIYRKWGSCE